MEATFNGLAGRLFSLVPEFKLEVWVFLFIASLIIYADLTSEPMPIGACAVYAPVVGK